MSSAKPSKVAGGGTRLVPVTPRAARALVGISSGAVLVLEILAGRLLAPYVGVSLETFTGIIGVALAGIALGAWLGGAVADTTDARRFIGAAIGLGGVFSFLVLPILDVLGPQFGDGTVAIVTLSMTAIFVPAAILSMVSPMVAKLALGDLGETGAVVGGLSAAGTLGALAGTFVTGFVLVAAIPTRLTLILLGAVLVVIGAVSHVSLTRTVPKAGAVVLVILTGLLSALSARPCQYETGYFCVQIVEDADNPSGRSLYLDGVRHAYVDFDDPTNLDIRYIRVFAAVAGTLASGPIDSLHIGGGGFSFPRYLEHVRPASTALAIEIDPNLVTLVEEELGLVQTDTLRVQVGDARRALDDLDADSFDLIVGDAFGSRSVPWHLATRGFCPKSIECSTLRACT